MIRTKYKIITVLALLILLLACSAFGIGKLGNAEPEILSAEDMEGRRLGGIIGKMPDNSAKIFFESILGEKLSAYSSYGNIPEVLTAIRSGKIQAAWFTDVTAEYLCGTENDLQMLEVPSLIEEDRFSFGMAVKGSDAGKRLCERLNIVLGQLEEEGELEKLRGHYIDTGSYKAEYTVSMMKMDSDTASGEVLRIGITGANPPLECISSEGRPYGFCVELMDKIGERLGSRIEFELLSNETIFTALMAGKIDAVFCYGSSHITTEGTKDFCVTDGYCDMGKYSFVVLK